MLPLDLPEPPAILAAVCGIPALALPWLLSGHHPLHDLADVGDPRDEAALIHRFTEGRINEFRAKHGECLVVDSSRVSVNFQLVVNGVLRQPHGYRP